MQLTDPDKGVSALSEIQTNKKIKKQLDIGSEPTFWFVRDMHFLKQDTVKSLKETFHVANCNTFRDTNFIQVWISFTDRQKVMPKSPLCNMHRWAQKLMAIFLSIQTFFKYFWQKFYRLDEKNSATIYIGHIGGKNKKKAQKSVFFLVAHEFNTS